jgi:hypothetical protein
MDISFTFGIFMALAVLVGIVGFRLLARKSKPASVRVVMWMAAFSAIAFAVEAVSWVAIRPFMSGESSAIPVTFVTVVDQRSGLEMSPWVSLAEVHHAGGGGMLLVDFGEPRQFLAFGFSPATTIAMIAVPALAAALGAYLSWLVFRLARSVLEGESFTAQIVSLVNRATLVVTVIAVAQEIIRLIAISNLYSELDEGSIVMRAYNPDFSLLLVAVGIAAFGQLLKSGVSMAKETAGLI